MYRRKSLMTTLLTLRPHYPLLVNLWWTQPSQYRYETLTPLTQCLKMCTTNGIRSMNGSTDVEVMFDDPSSIRAPLLPVKLHDVATQPHENLRLIDPMNHQLTDIAYLRRTTMPRTIRYVGAMIERYNSFEQDSEDIEVVVPDNLSTSGVPLQPVDLHDAAQRNAAPWIQLADPLDEPRRITTTLATPQRTRLPIKLSLYLIRNMCCQFDVLTSATST